MRCTCLLFGGKVHMPFCPQCLLLTQSGLKSFNCERTLMAADHADRRPCYENGRSLSPRRGLRSFFEYLSPPGGSCHQMRKSECPLLAQSGHFFAPRMSAFEGKADIVWAQRNVRLWP